MTAILKVAPLVLLIASCCQAFDGWPWDDDHVREDFHYSYPLSSGGQLALENSNGAVEISAWDRNEVQIDGTKFASSRDMLNDIHIEISPSANSIRVRTVIPSHWTHGSRGASYVIHVPRHVVLDEIQTSNGPIQVRDAQGTAHLRTSNGAIRTWDVSGDIDVETSNGPIELSGDTGNVRAHTSNGAIRGDVHDGSLDAGTSNGEISVRVNNPTSRPVRAESSNGRIDLTINGTHIPEIRATTSNSSIAVRLPGTVNANLDAETSHGSISTDFDVMVHGGQIGKSHLEGTIGSGGPTIELSSSNGSIQLLRQ